MQIDFIVDSPPAASTDPTNKQAFLAAERKANDVGSIIACLRHVSDKIASSRTSMGGVEVAYHLRKAT